MLMREGEGPGCREAERTLPAPAGPMTMTPYLLILAVSEGALESDWSCVEEKSVEKVRLVNDVHALL